MKKASFIVYHDIEEQTAIMTDEQIGQLFRAMLRFSKGGEPVIDDPFVALAFSFVRPTMERDRKKYEDTCKAHQEAGRMGGRPRKNQTAKGAEYSPTKSSEQPPASGGDFLTKNQMVSKKADNVNDNDTDNDNDSVREDVPVYVSVLDGQDTQDGQTDDCDTYERDYKDAISYAEKMGYQLSGKQKKKLRYFVKFFSFDVVTKAIDRAVFHGGKSATYVFRILQEWQDNHLHDTDAIEAYIAEREGGEVACAV